LHVNPTKAVVLARELDPYEGGVTPALLSVANRPLVRHALEWLEDGGIREVAIVSTDRIAAHAREAVGAGSDWSFATSWLVQPPGESLGESLAALNRFIGDEPFVLHLADSLARESLPRMLGDLHVDDLGAVVLTHGSGSGLAPVVDIRSRRGTGGGNPAHPLDASSAGVAIMGAGVLETTSALDAWPGCELNTLADHLTAIGGNVQTRRADAWWRFGDAADAVLDGNRFALERLRGEPVEAATRDSEIQGAVSIHPSARLDSSTVRGPAVIAAGAQLHCAYVGPFTSIGPDVVLEGAEIENSIVLAGASITHLSTRLEGSIVGPGARVFRDFRLPRAMRLNIGPGAEVAVT
jgi:glucose-1-phosphate thymidylyltransferase